MKTKVYIRADGNTEIGLGHVIRSLALADMLKDNFDCVFVTRYLSPYIEKEANAICTNVVKLSESDEHFNEFLSILRGDEIVVLDNYFYTTDFQKSIRDKGCKLVCIDDIHDKHFVADVVINHAGGITVSDYSVEPYTKCLLGTDYALLRPVFLDAAKQNREISEISEIFICFGGADKYDLTLKTTLAALEINNWKKIHVVIGGAYNHSTLFNLENDKLKIYRNLTSIEMCDLLKNCQLAIIPASTVSYEVFSVKMFVFLGYYVDNQEDIYKYFISQKTGVPLGDYRELSKEWLIDSFSEFIIDQTQLQTQKLLIDGNSKRKLIEVFKQLC